MSETADIVIIGAGIIGMSAALQLARRTTAKIIVLEKGSGPGEGSTGASSAVCRYKYTRPEMVRLAKDGINAYQNWPEFLGIKAPVARFHRHGVLWMADGRMDWPDEEAERLASFGIRTAVLDDQSVRERFPALNPCVVPPDLVTGEPHECRGGGRHLLELDGGYIDPMDSLADLVAAARHHGVDVRFRSAAAGIAVENGKVRGVTLTTGDRIACDALVCAAGPWCNAVFALAGLNSPWPLKPTRIQIVHIDRPPDVAGDIPVCVDIGGGIYFRTQNRGQQIIVGSVREEDEKECVEDPDDYPNYLDDDFAQKIVHALHHRIPGLNYRGAVRGYAGLYTVNRSDVHPIVGKTPLAGFYVANGFSGHGFKLAPAIGSLIAQEIAGPSASFDTSVDREFLAFDRHPIEIETKSVLA